jgi:cyclopropane fatty-acyl-phospholipid synthase-like methyltransferase
MSRKSTTLSPAYFEEKYRADIDPWRFRTSEYEREKYQATLNALTRIKYPSALEVGCSIGVLTGLLSQRCEKLLALDASATAINAAKSIAASNVEFRVATLPDEFPEGPFDLIVLSEVLYYFSKDDLERVVKASMEKVTEHGDILLCHWLGDTDYPLSGVEASELFAQKISRTLPVRSILHDEVYRLERFCAG